MLDFVNNYYEITEENIDQLRQMMKADGVRSYKGDEIDFNVDVQVGHILGNVDNDNPKQTGYWSSKKWMPNGALKKVTTELPKVIMTIE